MAQICVFLSQALVTSICACMSDRQDPRRWWMLPVILTGSFLSFLDFFIVNIALPAIHLDLGASPAQLQLVVAGYGIGFAVSLITGGRLGDIYGRRRVFLAGLACFTLASALCAVAPSAPVLIASRVVQAVAAATLTPQVLAIIRMEFAPGERRVAIGLYGTSMGLASIAAQVVGGVLVSADLFGWSWRPIFLINIPIGAVAFCLALRMLRESRSTAKPTLDLPGVALISVGLFLLVYPLVEGREQGWPTWSFAMLAASLSVLFGFIRYEQHVIHAGRTPLVALHLLRISAIGYGLVVSAAFFTGLAAFFVVLTVVLQTGLGYSAFAAGMMFLPFAVGFSVASAASGLVGARLGARIVNLGTALMALSLACLIVLPSVDVCALAVLFALYGVGQGFAQPALINTVVGARGVAGEDAGAAAGLFLTTAQSCIALGVAVIGDVFFAHLGVAPIQADYLAAMRVALSCNLTLQVATFLLVLKS